MTSPRLNYLSALIRFEGSFSGIDMTQQILIADDDDGILSALSLLMKSEGFTPVTVSSPIEALEAVRQQDICLVLIDLNYSMDTTSGEEGLKLIADIRKQDEIIPIIVMTGWGTIEVAVDAMKLGADDFIQKPWGNDRLLSIIQNQIKLANAQFQSQKLSQQNELLQAQVCPNLDIIAQSESIQKTLNIIQQVAVSDVNVLFTGENGTGKSMYARYIHDLSPRRHSPLVSVNMGAVTESLFESEMFGHVKGAFTDAKSARIGRVELADQGTLFLDEIANTPYSQQSKLLRILEENQFEKVGSSKTQTVDFRLLTATNSNLHMAVKDERFRQDLLYRINTVEIEIPPLKRRIEDIIPLAESFLKKVAKKYGNPPLSISSEAENSLKAYEWPGNVRELSHVMERAYILCKTDTVHTTDLGIYTTAYESQEFIKVVPENDLRTLEEIEISIAQQRLNHFNGNALTAAKSLGLSRSAFYRRLGKSKS